VFRFIYWYKRRVPQRYRPIVLVTGCSSGIGFALAEELYQANRFRVVITAREKNVDRLRQHFGENENFIIRALDVTSQAQQKSLIHEIADRWGSVDILVNNAGISYRSVVEHMEDQDERLQMETNYLGPMGLIRLVIPYMRMKGRGKIINISSVSGMLAMPTMASYSASKYALEGASEALWYEMRPFGINVSLVQPGFVHSNSFKNVYYSDKARLGSEEVGPYFNFYQAMTPFVARLMDLSRTPPEKVARLVMDVIYTVNPPLWIPATLDAEFFYYIRRIFPRRILHPLLYSFLPKVKTWGEGYTRKRPNFISYLFGARPKISDNKD
jgi:NAD(P)-dependent dehydrogenase (short-subunit alcohol dehydrogenase family)